MAVATTRRDANPRASPGVAQLSVITFTVMIAASGNGALA